MLMNYKVLLKLKEIHNHRQPKRLAVEVVRKLIQLDLELTNIMLELFEQAHLIIGNSNNRIMDNWEIHSLDN